MRKRRKKTKKKAKQNLNGAMTVRCGSQDLFDSILIVRGQWTPNCYVLSFGWKFLFRQSRRANWIVTDGLSITNFLLYCCVQKTAKPLASLTTPPCKMCVVLCTHFQASLNLEIRILFNWKLIWKIAHTLNSNHFVCLQQIYLSLPQFICETK